MVVNNIDEAKKFAAENVWPVVLKLSSPGLLHKTDSAELLPILAVTTNWQPP